MAPNTDKELRCLPDAIASSCASTDTANVQVSFSHIQLYVDCVEDISVYKELEDALNDNSGAKVHAHDDAFVPQGRDIVRQMLAGLGFRVTGARFPSSDNAVVTNTRSVLVTSKDPEGVKFVVTAIDKYHGSGTPDEYRHFDASNVRQFYEAHAGRQGIAVLAFCTNSVHVVEAQYRRFHPKLFRYSQDCGTAKVLEVYAYYKGDTSESDEDVGTVLRFVQPMGNPTECVLPGISPLAARFDDDSQAAYCDHWVSNVYSRTGFLKTLEETLGFNPKVDFNAGVVAAGEAQIESTVTGNTSTVLAANKMAALRDQSQVYLPINNALSDVGHVYGFLKQLGQGIQHIASRVENLTDFVQRANDNRKRTGEGFTFLQIPRSYYGTLNTKQLNENGLSSSCANAIMDACEQCHIMSADGAVDLDMTADRIDQALRATLVGPELEEYTSNARMVSNVILRSRYINLYSLLCHHISEESYVALVRNQILVDVQGDDLLYQIFTCNILQRTSGEESPFLEFIQRVCSDCKDENGCPEQLKPGCGGFGIRNFLTLFLSIEVSKAMIEVVDAKNVGDENRRAYAQAMVDCFTDQLNESNPILTEISEAMTEEGRCRDKMMQNAESESDVQMWRDKMEAAANAKEAGNEKLMKCSSKYKDLMRAIREHRTV